MSGSLPAGAVTQDDLQLVMGSAGPIRRDGGVITARQFHSIATSARTIVLAGTLTLASVLPTASLVYADAGDGFAEAESEISGQIPAVDAI